MRLAMIDGVAVPPERAVVSVYDRGFLYGDGVFETLRTYGGRPFALAEHMARLERSAARVLIRLPIDPEAIGEEVTRAIGLAGNAESYARVMVTRGEGPLGLDPSAATRPRRVVLVEPLVPPPREAYRDGIAVVLVRADRAADGTAAEGAKVVSYLASVLAMDAARRAGASEAIVVDARGRVVEGASSNVFVVRAGRAATPPEEAGILPGITRAWILRAAEAAGVAAEARPIDVDELRAADEVLVCSSIREILPVVRADGRPVGDGRPGPVTRRLHEELRRIAGAPGPAPWLGEGE